MYGKRGSGLRRTLLACVASVVRTGAVLATRDALLAGTRGAFVTATVVVVSCGAAFASCDRSADMPPPVLSLRDQLLGRERYEALAAQWQSYVDAHPDAAIAYVHLLRARRYAHSFETYEEQIELMERAQRVDPECAPVLAELASLQFAPSVQTGKPDLETVKGYSLRAIELDPDLYEPHINLMIVGMVYGNEHEVEEHARALVRKGGIPSPLLDFCYNLALSAEPGAILLTNGDNDTFGTVALQAVYGIRPDVRVVNMSLLNFPQYARTTLVGDGSGPLSAADIDRLERVRQDEGGFMFNAVLEELSRRVRAGTLDRPVHVAVTSPPDAWQKSCPQPLVMRGLVWRVAPGEPPGSDEQFAVDATATDSLITSVFRLDSATDFAFGWSAESSVGMLVANYVGIWRRVAAEYARAGDLEGVRRMLRAAVDMLQAHPELRHMHGHDSLAVVLDYWKKIDPDNQEVVELLRAVNE